MRTLSKRCASSKRRYLSKRLLSDRSPRAQGALRSMLYGGGDRDASNANPNFTKVLSMGEGARRPIICCAQPPETKLQNLLNMLASRYVFPLPSGIYVKFKFIL